MIEIRRLCAEEIPMVHRIWTVVYNGRRDYAKEEEQPSDPLAHPPEWFWGVFEKGKLLSALVEIAFLMRFDRQYASLSGIGGVGTLPEARKGGMVRTIFEKLLLEAYERGVLFSNLTPFSHAFYRNFGYELACARNNITIPTREFAHVTSQGEFIQIFPGDDTTALQEVHQAYIADINHGICRDYWEDNRAWKSFTKEDPYATGTFLYLWQDGTGKPRGYIKYQDQQDDDAHTMSVQELAFTDREALYGVLSIVKGLGTQFRKFQWLMPTFLDPTDFVNSMWDIEQRIIPRDMTRVINVKAALEKMRCPEGEGSYILEVEDRQIPGNTGRYLVEYGSKTTRVTNTHKPPHVHCDIPVLSQLVTGYRTLKNALRTKQAGLEVYGNREILDAVFTLRPQHVTEYF
jgi:predicted acetyltransferase